MNKSRTLKFKIRSILFVIAILQIAIIVGVIVTNNTMQNLDESTEQTLISTSKINSAALENELISWGDLSSYEQNIQSMIANVSDQTGMSVSQLAASKEGRQHILDSSVDLVLENLRNKGVTESFILLGDGNVSEAKQAVILRDLNPNDNPETNYDVLVEAGSADLMFEHGFTLDSYWSEELILPKQAEFFQKPFDAGNQYPKIDAQKLGYYCPTFRLRDHDIQMMTYAMPLLDENHHSIEVIGVGISMEYLGNFISSRGIGIGKNGSYYVGVATGKDTYQTVYVESEQYKGIFPKRGEISLLKNKADDLYQMETKDEKTPYEMSTYTCRLYYNNTPFEEEEWIIGAFTSSQTLHEASRNLKSSLAIACIVALLLAIFSVFLITNSLTRPIATLFAGLEGKEQDVVQLPRTRIREFDELAKEIESRAREISQSASKVSDIIEMAGVEVGVIEFRKESERVFCTKKFLQMMELDCPSWRDNYVTEKTDVRRLQELQQKIEKEEDEKNTYRFTTKSGYVRWFNVREVTREESTLSVFLDITDNVLEKEKIKHDRDYDVLTNLYNRRAFESIVSGMMNTGMCGQGVLSIWDLDHLKYMNDTYGHDVGDQYIRLLADVLGSVGENGIASRMAGDEFVVFVYGEDVPALIERTRKLHRRFIMQRFILPDGSNISVSVSGGMAIYDTSEKSYKKLLQYADFAMYEVKKSSKGAIKLFDAKSYQKNNLLVNGVGELNHILQEKLVQYAFQPIVDVQNRCIFAYEALIRPESKIIRTPGELLRIAEAQSKLGEIERMSWFLSMADFHFLEKQNRNIKLFINSIPNQCLTSEEFEELERTYEDFLPNMVVEVTEEMKTDERKEAKKAKWCKKHGVAMALDDYGSGYSNSDMLISKKFQYVKLDMTLIRDIHLHPDNQELIAGMITFCHTNGQKVVAEGIENEEELKVVIRLGVDYVQGFFLAKPSFEECSDEMIQEKFRIIDGAV